MGFVGTSSAYQLHVEHGQLFTLFDLTWLAVDLLFEIESTSEVEAQLRGPHVDGAILEAS
jgi:hypothetical protein